MKNADTNTQLRKLITDQLDEIKKLKHYKKISKFLRDCGFDNFTQEEIYCIVNEIEKPQCKDIKFVSFSVGYRTCFKGCQCYKESLSTKISKIKSLYTDNQKIEISKKRKNTVNRLYGVDNVFQLESTKEKSMETKISKYENPFYNNRNKAKETNQSVYGVDNPAKTEEVKDKISKTNIDLYGYKTPLQNDEIKNKIKKTLFDKFGVYTPMHSLVIKEKIKDTNLKKYGVENISRIHLSEDAIEFLDNKHIFEENLQKYSIFELAEQYKISLTPIYDRIAKYEIKEYIVSGFQRSVINFLREIYDKKILINVRSIIDKELDIFLPDVNLAIECNGTYWHSELNGKTKYYHKEKTDQCRNLGIHLIHIWEHSWNSKKDVIKSIIRHKLKLSTKIYARECIVRSISLKESKDFINKNHIQNSTNSAISLGLYYKDQLMSVMTFGKSRFNKNYKWELLRYCTSKDYVVVGGASKLFKKFIKDYNPDSIITYSDYSIMNGNVYKSLGFNYYQYSPPSYFYTKNYCDIFHRIHFQKRKLEKKLLNFNKEKTEWQNMKEHGYDRIWDCGNDVWIWKAEKVIDIKNN